MDPTAVPQVINALLALGMAVAFIAADRRSPTSRALGLFLGAVGLAIGVGTLVAAEVHDRVGVRAWDGIFAIPETLAFVFAYEWLLRVRRTVPTRDLYTEGPDRLVRIAQGLAVLYAVFSAMFPYQRDAHFVGDLLLEEGAARQWWFYLFFTPLAVSLLLATFAGLLLFKRRPDKAETLRVVAFVIGAPFMASGMVLPRELSAIPTTVGLLIFLYGAVQYHVIQGRRAQFMSRFLSPQVAELVHQRGLRAATQENTLELSVVCCDLRGFTAFSKAKPSQKVIRILREYYDAVGVAADAPFRFLDQFDLGDQAARCRVPPGELDAGCFADQAASAVASDEIARPQRRAVGQRDVDAGVVLREPSDLGAVLDVHAQLVDPLGEDALDVVLP